MQQTSLSGFLGEHIVREKEAHDLSRNPELAAFQFVGYRTSPAAVELVALCDADELTEGDIVRRRDEFFDLVRNLPHDFGLKPRGRNPNGLLGFVFADGCPEPMARFIARQTRISHVAGTGGVSVAWAIDVKNRRIHTHDNPVSIFPPVIVAARSVYPGLEFMESLLGPAGGDAGPPPRPSGTEEPDEHGSGIITPEPVLTSPEPGGDSGSIHHILLVAVNSISKPLDVDWEIKEIVADLRMAKDRDRFPPKTVLGATIGALTQAMLDDPPTIVHFSGHGRQDGVILRSAAGGWQLVPGEALASLFAPFSPAVKCVVLNLCWSEPQARAIHRHVPYVIGTRDRMPDDAALAFSRGFYKAYAARRDVRFAFEIGKAIVQAEGNGDEELLVLLEPDSAAEGAGSA
jgi:hypothetical protein